MFEGKGVRRTVKILSVLCSLAALLAVVSWAADPTSNQVYVYEHINYDGAYMRFDGLREVPDLRSYNTGALGTPNWNDRISSLKVGSEVKLVVFADINYKGASWTVTGPASIKTLVSNGWNDRISSFRIVPK
jgi:hypothetical protein